MEKPGRVKKLLSFGCYLVESYSDFGNLDDCLRSVCPQQLNNGVR